MLFHPYGILIIFSTPEILSSMSLFFNSNFQILCMDGLLACLPVWVKQCIFKIEEKVWRTEGLYHIPECLVRNPLILWCRFVC